MRQEVFAVILVLLVVGSLSVGYFGGVGNRQSTTLFETTTGTTAVTLTTTLGSFFRCNATYSPSLVEGTKSNTSWTVFVDNSTAFVCVDISYESSLYPNSELVASPTIFMLQDRAWYDTSNLHVTVIPQSAQVPSKGVNWYVFKIVPLNLTKAIYDVGLPDDCWTHAYFLVAVGYTVSQIQESTLGVPYAAFGCQNLINSQLIGNSTVIGISNLIPVYSK
jgi:hypothetical protein